MTFQTTDQPTAAEHLKPYRPLIGFVLLGVTGFELLIAYWSWLLPPGSSQSFGDRSLDAFLRFTTVSGLVLPLLAVLITTMIAPVVRQAKTITLIALVEYGLMALGALVTALLGFGQLLEHTGWALVTGLSYRLMMLTVLGVDSFVVLRIYLGAYPKAAPAAGYGGGYPGQSYPGYPPQGYPQPAAAPAQQAAQQTQYAPQAQYAQQYGQQHQQQPHYQAHQAQPSQQAGYGHPQQSAPYQAVQPPGYQATAPNPAAPASPAATSSAAGQPGPAPEPEATQQYSAEPTQQATGWPPTPGASGSPWPPTPSTGQSTDEDASHTQMLRPEQYRGNAPG
ncbi:MAG TPA: hypothetical protein VFZ32_13775 [Micromonosporaceae bacterium]